MKACAVRPLRLNSLTEHATGTCLRPNPTPARNRCSVTLRAATAGSGEPVFPPLACQGDALVYVGSPVQMLGKNVNMMPGDAPGHGCFWDELLVERLARRMNAGSCGQSCSVRACERACSCGSGPQHEGTPERGIENHSAETEFQDPLCARLKMLPT